MDPLALIAMRARTWSSILIILTVTWMLLTHPLIYRASIERHAVEDSVGDQELLRNEGIYIWRRHR